MRVRGQCDSRMISPARLAIDLTLRTALLMTAVGWGLGGFPLVMSDQDLWYWLNQLAGGPVPEHPVIAYWVRMAACVCVLVALLGLWATLRVHRERLLPWVLTWFQLGCAAALWWWGTKLGLTASVWGIDVYFCLLTGVVQAVLLLLPRGVAGPAEEAPKRRA